MRCVIIGQSAAAAAVVRGILERNSGASITLLSCDGQLPYDREALPGLLTAQRSRAAVRKTKVPGESDQYQLFSASGEPGSVFIEPLEFYRNAGVDVVLDKEISRINFRRQKIYLAGKTSLEYDHLFLTDTPEVRWPAARGIKRTGVFCTVRLASMRSLVRYLPFIETAVVEISGWNGLRAALALRAAGREVVVVERGARLLASRAGEAVSSRLARWLEQQGIRVLTDSGVEDVLGDNETKAVRLKSGKVLACEAAVFDIASPDLRFMDEGDLLMTESIPVDSVMRTNVPGVFALDAMARLEVPAVCGSYDLPRALAETQARVAVEAAFGAESRFDMELPIDADRLAGIVSLPAEEMVMSADLSA